MGCQCPVSRVFPISQAPVRPVMSILPRPTVGCDVHECTWNDSDNECSMESLDPHNHQCLCCLLTQSTCHCLPIHNEQDPRGGEHCGALTSPVYTDLHLTRKSHSQMHQLRKYYSLGGSGA